MDPGVAYVPAPPSATGVVAALSPEVPVLLSFLLPTAGAIRVLIGLAPFVAPAASARMLGFPADHDNATARLIARLFGARDAGLGVLAFWAVSHPEMIGAVCLFNAAHDAVDASSAVAALVGRQGIDRGAAVTAAFALTGGAVWILGWWLSTP